MLPQHLIVQFWQKVQDLLETEHRVPGEAARKGIVDYIALSEKHAFADMVYHRDPDDVAETIAGAVRQGGFKEPRIPAPR